MVYLNQSASEAVSWNVIIVNSEGKELREAFWIKSGKAKGNKTYFTKDGKNYPLPGYSLANSMCIAATGEDLDACMKSSEKKTVNIYNVEQKKEVPTERPVIMGLINKPVKVAVHQVVEDRMTKGSNGSYQSTGETRTVNNCKFFGNSDGKTAEEIENNTDAVMFDKWAAKNTGNVIDNDSITTSMDISTNMRHIFTSSIFVTASENTDGFGEILVESFDDGAEPVKFTLIPFKLNYFL